MITIKEKQKKAFEILSKEFKYKNVMQAPKLEKVLVSVGFGSIKDKKKVELIADRIAKITGQKAALRVAKKSIASFKLRENDPIAYQITLRGPRMFDFLERLIHIALPRTKDFRGLNDKSIDQMGNFSFGIPEHTIFPETSDEELKDIFSLGVTVVVSSRKKAETKAFLELIGFPFKKEGVK